LGFDIVRDLMLGFKVSPLELASGLLPLAMTEQRLKVLRFDF
jgi:hypothetical protein